MNNPTEKQDSSQELPEKKYSVNRTMVGLITLGCLGSAVWLHLFQPNATIWEAGFIRIGLLMGAIWLALPTKTRKAAWAGISLPMMVSIALAIAASFTRIPNLIILGVWCAWWVLQFVLKPLPGGTKGKKQ